MQRTRYVEKFHALVGEIILDRNLSKSEVVDLLIEIKEGAANAADAAPGILGLREVVDSK